MSWLGTAVIVSIALPAVAVLVWRDDPAIRAALLPYMLVLLVQIPSERALTRRFGPDMSPITGLIYTSYRVWQLWYLQGYIAATPGPITLAHDVARGLLLFGLGFWTVNLLFLAGVALPRTVALSHAHAT